MLTRRGLVHELEALEHVLVVGCREDEVVLRKVVPHEPVLVAPETIDSSINTGGKKRLPRKNRSGKCHGQGAVSHYLLQDHEYIAAMPLPRTMLR